MMLSLDVARTLIDRELAHPNVRNEFYRVHPVIIKNSFAAYMRNKDRKCFTGVKLGELWLTFLSGYKAAELAAIKKSI